MRQRPSHNRALLAVRLRASRARGKPVAGASRTTMDSIRNRALAALCGAEWSEAGQDLSECAVGAKLLRARKQTNIRMASLELESEAQVARLSRARSALFAPDAERFLRRSVGNREQHRLF